MSQIRIRKVVADIRSGMSDDELMSTYGLTRKGLQKLTQLLVSRNAISHEEMYEKSSCYRHVSDMIAARHWHRFYIPRAFRIFDKATWESGFIRDISENGIRVAGMSSKVGDSRTFSLPIEDPLESDPLEFEAVCRWSEEKGRRKKYMVNGFEITSISEEARQRLLVLIELLRLHDGGGDWTLKTGHPMTDLLEFARQMSPVKVLREFSGRIDGVDILELVQFALLNGRKTVIHVRSSKGEECELYLDGGKVIHAVQGALTGREAFFACMNFPAGEFCTQPWKEPSQHSIQELGDFLLMEAARRRDEALCRRVTVHRETVCSRAHVSPRTSE